MTKYADFIKSERKFREMIKKSDEKVTEEVKADEPKIDTPNANLFEAFTSPQQPSEVISFADLDDDQFKLDSTDLTPVSGDEMISETDDEELAKTTNFEAIRDGLEGQALTGPNASIEERVKGELNNLDNTDILDNAEIFNYTVPIDQIKPDEYKIGGR